MSAIAIPGDFRVPAVPLSFDKVPEKLPDWWEEEDEDDDKEDDDIGDDKSYHGDERGNGGGGDNGSDEGSDGGNGGKNGGDNGGDNDGLFTTLFAQFLRWMTVYPVCTNPMTTSLLAILGGPIAQRIERRLSSDYARDTRRIVAVGI